MDGKVVYIGLLIGLATLIEANCPICGNMDGAVVQVAKDRAIQWLAGQQNVDGSWPNLNTQNAILALQLADPDWMASQTLDTRLLTTSRLKFELMEYMLSDRVQCRRFMDGFELGAGRLGQYMLALSAVCDDINDFYNIDLVELMKGLLRNYPEDNFNNFFAHSFAIMSLCSSNEIDIPWRALVQLAEGFNSSDPCDSQFGGHSIDILSLQVMAMICATDQAMSKRVHRWETILDTRVQCISDSQNAVDGSFGNAITTALAIQALTASNTDGWDCVSAMEWLLTQQKVDGDFDGVGGTAQILPILGCNNFANLEDTSINCPNFDDHLRPNLPPIDDDDEIVNFKIQVRVDNTITNYTTTILDGENLYFGMIRLEENNEDFSFESIDSSFGQSLQAINDVTNDPSNSLYWTFRINELDNYAPKGIEGLFPTEEITYIFIYTDFS